LTADGKNEYIQNTGHGDIFQDNEGAWWAVVLGIRNEDGRFPMGRETFLTPVTWPENGWPEIAQPRLQFERSDVTTNYTGFQRSLLLEMVYIRVPVLDDYQISSDVTNISIKANSIDISAFDGSPSFCGRRQTAIECSVVATLLLPPGRTKRSLRAGLTVFKDSFRHAEIFFDIETRNIIFRLVNKADKVGETVKISDIEIGWAITQIGFRIRATKRSYEFDFRVGGEPWVELAVIDAIEMTARDFTGTVFGVFAHQNEEVNEDVVEFVDFKQY
jgi:beta-xylosidase